MKRILKKIMTIISPKTGDEIQDAGFTRLPEGLPKNLAVSGDLAFGEPGSVVLPENLTVGGNLDLRGPGSAALPEDLTLYRGRLDLTGAGGA